MDVKDVLLKELQAKRAKFNSSLSPDEKADAFRKQSIILDEITSSSSESDKVAVFRSHFKELNNRSFYKSFIEERSKSVEMMVRRLPSCTSHVNLSADEYLRKQRSLHCSGKYENCLEEEVTTEDLKTFQKILGNIPSDNLLESPSRKRIHLDTLRTEQGSSTSATNERKLNLNSFFSKNSSQNNTKLPSFRTAREELVVQNMKKNGESASGSCTLFNYGASKKSLGARRNVRSGFVPPIRQENSSSPTCSPSDPIDASPTEPVDIRLRNIDPKMVELISNEIMHKDKAIGWDDIAGLEYAKSTIKEAVVWPLLRPDIFIGLRRPTRGILLFGPPGTGKTLIGKCIASQLKSTFFSISASSLTSKWVGDGEKMVRALFAVAAVHQPSVIFIDEIDSLLSQRSSTEHESSRRLKTEFLVQLDGANTTDDDKILIVGATNRPQELDEAARRRLVRRLYIPLPELPARIQILTNLLKTVRNNITREEIAEIGNLTNGYSGADMETLCREASMEPIRSIPIDEIAFISEANVGPVQLEDFRSALLTVRASVSQLDLQQYVDWNRIYGAGQ